MAGRPRTRTAGRGPLLLLAVAISMAVSCWIAPAGFAQGTASAHSSASAPLGGVNIPGVTRGESLAGVDREIAMAHALHAKVVRVELPWSELEPLGPNQIDPGALAVSDRLMSDAATVGIGVIALVESTPCWASAAPAALLQACSPAGSSRAASWPPREPAAYAAFVAYLAQRYGTALAAIEI